MVDILLVGSGGRESTLEWKLRKDPQVDRVYTSPGNGGTKDNLPYTPSDFEKLAKFAEKEELFTIIGPEKPLADGIVDFFIERELKIFGPTRNAAQLEASKSYAKNFMKLNEIPTSEFEVFTDFGSAKEYIMKKNGQVVIKADGLAAGKGVAVCRDVTHATSVLSDLMVYKKLGEAGSKVVIEDVLKGEELSCFYLSDGKNIVNLSTAQDHKTIFEGDQGPNTGGMGSYSPSYLVSENVKMEIDCIADTTIKGMARNGNPFKGILYLGLMINESKPYVLEYNVRLGDPETQVVLPMMKSHLYPYLDACSEGRLSEIEPIEWNPGAAICVVMVSKGYPGKYEIGKEILGLQGIECIDNVHVFHAGTKRSKGKVLTDGGRVLGVTAVDDDLRKSVEKVYPAVESVSWEGEYHRQDIGWKAL